MTAYPFYDLNFPEVDMREVSQVTFTHLKGMLWAYNTQGVDNAHKGNGVLNSQHVESFLTDIFGYPRSATAKVYSPPSSCKIVLQKNPRVDVWDMSFRYLHE